MHSASLPPDGSAPSPHAPSAAPVRRAVFSGPGECRVETAELPLPLPGEVRVRARLSLISPGTELALLHRTHPGFEIPGFGWARYPFWPGYSLVGSAETEGESIAAGARVFARAPHATRSNVARAAVFGLPDMVSDEQAAFLGLAKIAWTAVLQAPPRPGEHVVVVGLGLVGNLAAQLMRLAGAEVVGTDLSAARREIGRACGIEVAEPDAFEPFRDPVDLRPAGRPTLVVDAVGSAATIDTCLNLVAPRGRVVLLGAPRSPVTVDAYLQIMRKGVAWIGAHEMHGEGEAVPATIERLIGALGAGSLRVEPLIRGTFPLEEAGAAYAALGSDPEGPPGVFLDLR